MNGILIDFHLVEVDVPLVACDDLHQDFGLDDILKQFYCKIVGDIELTQLKNKSVEIFQVREVAYFLHCQLNCCLSILQQVVNLHAMVLLLNQLVLIVFILFYILYYATNAWN